MPATFLQKYSRNLRRPSTNLSYLFPCGEIGMYCGLLGWDGWDVAARPVLRQSFPQQEEIVEPPSYFVGAYFVVACEHVGGESACRLHLWVLDEDVDLF